MIINMSEVNIDNINDWSTYTLEKFRNTLESNINKNLGEIESQQLMLQLIKLEIDGQNRIKRINLGVDLEKAKIIKQTKEKGADIDIWNTQISV